MPYIKQEDRKKLLEEKWPSTAGELNYMITVQILRFLKNKGTINYQILNDVIGALEGAKQEFYRRTVIPYEDEKIKENGDVE